MRIAIVGGGKRVQHTILPAICALEARCAVAGIYTRNARTLSLPDGRHICTQANLEEIDLKQIDLVILAVPSGAIRNILSVLSKKPHCDKVILLVDTPPARISDLLRMRSYKCFQRVEVAEDWIALKPVRLMRRMIDEGLIGDMKHLDLNRMSYRYHGVATLKYLSSENLIRKISVDSSETDAIQTDFTLGVDKTAKVLHPRNYHTGYIRAVGHMGVACWSRNAPEEGIAINITTPEAEAGWYQPVYVNDELVEPDPIEQVMMRQDLQKLQKMSHIHKLKIRGYADILETLSDGRSFYSLTDGLYDYVGTVMAEKAGKFYDFQRAGSKKSFIGGLLQEISN